MNGDNSKVKVQQWFLLGDIHGSVNPIKHFYIQNRDRLHLDETNNNIILLGDVGANFALRGERDRRFKKKLSEYPFTYICLRGNHEARVANVIRQNPNAWETVTKYNSTVYREREFPNIEYLEDGPAVYEFSGYKTLAIPGAYSVDKWYRLANDWTWYADEQLNEKEMQRGRFLKKAEGPFDLVISHTCPMYYEPTDLFIPDIDQSKVDKSMEIYLDELECDLNYKRWAWGHYHADRLYPWNDGKQMLMLYNENVVNLQKFMNMKEQDSFQDII